MIELSLADIAAIVGGRLVGADPGRTVTGKVEFDSRKVVAGDLFLAIAGNRVDGHDYARAAVEAGAVAVLASRAVPVPAIAVADPIAAITSLARAVAPRLPASIIGITGSSGKTSTKDLLAQVLAVAGVTVATPGSFNNELGYPYTVLLADENTQYLVLETSSRGLGHIRHLTGIAAPRLAAVLNVGSAHLSEFGTVETIALAKGELVEALPSAADGGVAVLNADDPLVSAMAARTSARVVTAGERPDADVRAEAVVVDSSGRAGFELVSAAGRAGVRLNVRGEHQVSNAVIVAALALACGMELPAVAQALSRATERSAWRMQVSETAAGITVINDAYNANPESMRAALKALATMSEGRRSIAVLGHMAELGPDAIAQHDALGRHLVGLDISALIAVGEQARAIATGAALEGSYHGESEWVPDAAAALARLGELLRPGDVVLVKGSRSAAMEVVAQALIQRFDSTDSTAGAPA
ncbi:MAG TPA: UDP-N-acetylmuramoyl-tripeptide--D-alanyl-D-alanine ligase [Jatrophihabitans sp.]|nr:UDP-N-acetylmuramoyl-tripeptide--D-alanyl-D-alanine ligase [Jatrophihabitans sp.]